MPARSAVARAFAAFAVTIGLALGAVLAVASPAAAHSGPIEFRIAGDGVGGLVVNAQYIKDGHAVDSAELVPIATAVSKEGTTVGPVPLVLSDEGIGLYTTEEPILTEGSWSVTVASTVPVAATSTVGIDVAPPPAPPAAGEDAAGSADPVDAAAPAAPGRTGFTGWLWIGIAAVVVALGSVVVVMVVRRRTAAREAAERAVAANPRSAKRAAAAGRPAGKGHPTPKRPVAAKR
ncbi:hypothetical protein [Compostimonas suwonensis]|uniref:CopC domain-containing protein n=1 Tax=Compostimonas suwonensis TaxID=1048394 RepID=A0A2M9BCS0_9MICO|nr:hypothetical protein [Compostimonas suwonensis]PJJ55751.1 hypothetical protein CLV54_3102 [Compostimonas suwonensis]